MLTSDFYDTGHGGVEGHILGITRCLQSDGHEVVIVRVADRPIIHDYDPCADTMDYRILPSAAVASRGWASKFQVGGRAGLVLEFSRRLVSGARSWRHASELLDLVGSVDVIHQHNFLESVGLTKALARRGARVVWTNHLGEFLYLRRIPVVGRLFLRLLTLHYADAVAPSSELADQAAIATRVRVVPNGVDIERFRPPTGSEEVTALRAKFGWPRDRPIVIVPRRWAPTKGVLFAAQAMQLKTWPAEAYVVFAGSGTREYPGYSEQILDSLRSSGCRYETHESVTQETMAEMLRSADVCLIPSVKEATSLSALEAMASGPTVVAAAVGGLPEIIVHERTGYLHTPQDPRAIAEMVRCAIESDAPVSEAAREFVADGYSWSAVMARTVEMYGLPT